VQNVVILAPEKKNTNGKHYPSSGAAAIAILPV
jgi:hypothetical protein